jgi:sensor histidine kinase YesM
LFYVAIHNGFNSSYNFLTPAESEKYERALASKKKWAIEREKILTESHLNTPKKTKYVIQWFFLLMVATVIAYYFNGVSYQIFRIIPKISKELETAIEESINTEKVHLNELAEIEEQKFSLTQAALKSELDMLKSQLNPHFLYNTLNYFFIKSYDYSDELAESIRKLSDIMRYSLKSTDIVSELQGEIECVKMLISLHQVRYENNLFIQFNEDVNHKKEILPLILVTLVENAFKHGILNDSNIPLIITIKTTETDIIFDISNKISKRKSRKSTNLGLQNIKNRLDLYYKENYKLTISNDDIIYTCKLTIQSP